MVSHTYRYCWAVGVKALHSLLRKAIRILTMPPLIKRPEAQASVGGQSCLPEWCCAGHGAILPPTDWPPRHQLSAHFTREQWGSTLGRQRDAADMKNKHSSVTLEEVLILNHLQCPPLSYATSLLLYIRNAHRDILTEIGNLRAKYINLVSYIG